VSSAKATTSSDQDGRATTIADVWSRAVASGGSVPPFLEETGDGWRPVGWDEAGSRVAALAAGLEELGVDRGDRVAILSRTRLEWTLCDFALARLGAVSVPIYQTSSREECAHILADAGARVLVCENGEQLEKTEGLEREVPGLERRLAIDAAGDVPTLDELAGAASTNGRTQRRPAAAPPDVLTFIYTSGTTGPPKGCVLTHANFVAELEAIGRIRGLFVPGDTILLFLPLAHNFARLIQYCAARFGLTIAFCAEPTRLREALHEVRPTVIPAVPRVFEKLHATIEGGLAAETGLKRWIGIRALAVGRRRATLQERSAPVPALLAAQARLADRLVFAKVKERLGGRLRLAISGGAPLARELSEFFAGCGLPVLEGYGLSETTSGCTVNRPDAYRFGTVGLPLPGVEVAVAADGELMVRGPTVFRGYHGRPDETAAALTEDGWLRTGDIGTIDEDGFVTITDRKKELIVTAGGKKIAPQALENALTSSPLVAQSLIVGDRRPYVVALLTLDDDEVARLPGGRAAAEAMAAEAVEAANRRLGRTEQIKRFAVLPRQFSIEQGEITPTLKLRRAVCEEHFSAEIEALYAGGPGGAAA
jgi:long-chain acyl-CoA synthetase